MSFKAGEKIKLHDGTTLRVRKGGRLPTRAAAPVEAPRIRGFIRGELVDCLTGEKQTGDWHENVITTYGHGQVIRNFVGLAGSSFASYWQIGYHTDASTNFSTRSNLQTVLGLDSSNGAASVSRATVSVGSQNLSGTWTLYQSFQYASSQVTANATINAIAQHGHAHISSGSAYSIATFDSSVKSSTQALNVSYHWLFST